MKAFISLVIAGMGVLCLLPSVLAQTATWSSAASSSKWDTTAHWVEGVIPTSTSNVTINACTVCPTLNTNVIINSLSVKTNASINLQGNTLTSVNVSLTYATINSSGGTIKASNISEVSHNNFNGAITLEKNGPLMNMWAGGNTFNGPTTISFDVIVTDYSYLRTGRNQADTFNEDATINNLGGTGIVIGYGNSTTIFKKKLTCNSNNRHRQPLQIINLRCEGELVLNAHYMGNILVGNTYFNRSNFVGTVRANILSAEYYGGNAIFFTNCSFQSPVVITSTSTNLVQYNPYGIFFGNNNGTCIFTPTASLQISENGFLRGDLSLERCTFQNSTAIALNLSSGLPSPHRVGRLIVGTGTSFNGSFEGTAPNIFLNGATFKQEATFTKTGAGINNSAGGNIFKKKVTITNQANASSPINLATQVNDIIQQ